MQEPSELRNLSSPQVSEFFAHGIVINQETVPPHRVQVRIPGLHTDVSDADLPYYRVMFPCTASGHNGRSGQFSTLARGTQVQVLLYDKKGYNAAVIGWFSNTSNDVQGSDIHGWRDDFGNSFRVAADGSMTLASMAGASFTIDKHGSATFTLKDLTINVNNVNFTGEQLALLFTTLTQTANTWSVSATSPSITDGAGGGGSSGQAPTLTPPQLPATPDVANKTDL